MSTLKVTTIQNLSGTEVYTAKAWVNFNGTGTVAIRASGNVSSITDNGTGQYTVNFTVAMVDANYATMGAFNWSNNGNQFYIGTAATTSIPVSTLEANAYVDRTIVNVAVFR